MDGNGRWMDNVFSERLWRSVKYEGIDLKGYETVAELKAGIGGYLAFHNSRRTRRSLGRLTPDQVYPWCHGLREAPWPLAPWPSLVFPDRWSNGAGPARPLYLIIEAGNPRNRIVRRSDLPAVTRPLSKTWRCSRPATTHFPGRPPGGESGLDWP
jgi:hypothetical protein